MAVLIGKKLTEQTSGGTITPSFSGLDIQAGDWIGICLTNDHPTGTTPTIAPPAGWAKVDTAFTVSGGIEHGWIYKLAASSSEAAPVITVNNDDCMALVEVWRYVDQTTPIDCVATRADWNLVSSAACNVASASAGAVVIYSVGADSAHRMRFKLADAVCDDRRYSSGAAIAHLVGHRQIESAGNFAAITAYGRDAAEGGTFCAFALRNATGGAKQPDVRVTAQELAWHGAFGQTHDGITWQAPDQFAGTGVTIGGYAVSATAPTVGYAVAETTAANWGTATQLTTTDATANILMGGCHAITAADLTGCVASVEWRTNLASTSSRAGAAGVLLGFSDGTNWSVFQLASKDYSWDTADIHASMVACATGKATVFASSGTLSWAAVNKVGYFWHKATASSGDAMVLRNLTAISKVALTGGGALRPARPTDISTALGAMGHIELARLQSTKQVQVRHNVQIGDGTNATYYDHTGYSVEYPGRWSASIMDNWQMYWNVAANALEIRVKAKASDTVNLKSGVFATDVEQNFVMDPATSASATYSNSGVSLFNWAYAGDTDAPVNGGVFAGCDTVAFAGADVTGAIVSATTSTNASASFDANGAVVTTSEIDGTGAAYAIELASTVKEITLASSPITAGSADKIHALKTAATVVAGAFVVGDHYEIKTVGTTDFTLIGASANTVGVRFTATGAGSGTGDTYAAVKITISGTTSLAEADVTSAGAVVWVAAPELYQSVALTGLEATYRVQIFDIEYDLTVSGITVTPTAGATYTHNGITWTVRSASIVAGAGTLTVYGAGTPATSGTLTKTGGTGDASVSFSAYAVGGTELYIGVPGATSYTWTDTVAATAPRVIRVRVMEDGPGTADAILMIDAIVGVCGITDGTEAVGYLVAAVADDIYNDRGVDGSTITGITIDDSTLRLEIASGTIINYNGTDVLVIDGRDIYAYETYWLGTTAGMRDQARVIEAVDAVNFRCSGFKLKGTSGYPIMIRNCYLVDAATGIFASLVDYSGDPISNAPDHMAAIVVSTSDSVVTGTLAEFVAAVPSALTMANACGTRAVDGAKTQDEILRLMASVVGGKVSGAGTGTETFRGVNDDKDRIVATVDSSGNRSLIILDLT